MKKVLRILFGAKFYGAEMCIALLCSFGLGFHPDRWLTIITFGALLFVFVQLINYRLADKR